MTDLAWDIGDNVEVCDNLVTRQLGIAGLRAVVFGFTTPSSTPFVIHGLETGEDYALFVGVQGQKDEKGAQAGWWLPPRLLRFIDRGFGYELHFKSGTLIKTEAGWVEKNKAR